MSLEPTLEHSSVGTTVSVFPENTSWRGQGSVLVRRPAVYPHRGVRGMWWVDRQRRGIFGGMRV